MLRQLFLALMLVTFATPSALAQTKRVTVHVEGMACPFCAFNLEKRIKTLDGVADKMNWQTSIEQGTASFNWKPDVPVDKEAIREQIRKAGFTPGKVEVAASEQNNDNPNEKAAGNSPRAPATEQTRRAVLDPKMIQQAADTSAKQLDNGVVKITWARQDVPVRVDGMRLPPSAGLTSWAAFKANSEGGAVVMGDTVVFQDEVDAAMDAAFAQGLSVTALHNHFFFDEPKVYFMHINGHGNPQELAGAVKAMWDAIKQVRQKQPEPAEGFPGPIPEPGGELDVERLARLTGLKAAAKPDGVVKVSTGREGQDHGVTVGEAMGLNSWAAFTGSDELASIDGDFIMTANEVQPVMHVLREHGLHVVALHNHMIGEQPAFYFLHFWGKGPADELARGFRAALDAQKQAK